MKLAVFDVDGTLVDSQALIIGAMAQAMEGAGLPVLDRDQVLSIVGLSLPLAVATLLPDQPEARQNEVVAGYRAAFMSRSAAGHRYRQVAPGLGCDAGPSRAARAFRDLADRRQPPLEAEPGDAAGGL